MVKSAIESYSRRVNNDVLVCLSLALAKAPAEQQKTHIRHS